MRYNRMPTLNKTCQLSFQIFAERDKRLKKKGDRLIIIPVLTSNPMLVNVFKE